MKYYFTFGFGQEHEKGFHVIEADGWDKAREIMVKKFGIQWSMQYDENEWNWDGKSQQERYNLKEIK
jgi:hypothetical protein